MNPSITVPMFLGEHIQEWVRVLCTHNFYLFGLVDIPGLEKTQGCRDHSPVRKNFPYFLLTC